MANSRLYRFAILSAALVVAFAPSAIVAHPHVLPTVRASVVFDENGRLAALRQVWSYDPAYSTFVMRGVGKPDGSALFQSDLKVFADTQVNALFEHRFFTLARTLEGPIEFGRPREYSAVQSADGRLELSFTLPVTIIPANQSEFFVEIHDPNYFAYFTIEQNGISIDNARSNCSATFTGPQPIDLKQTKLIPAAFWQALNGSKAASEQFVNRISVACQ